MKVFKNNVHSKHSFKAQKMMLHGFKRIVSMRATVQIVLRHKLVVEKNLPLNFDNLPGI